MKEDFNILENALLFAPEGTRIWSDVDGLVELDRYHDKRYNVVAKEDSIYPLGSIHTDTTTGLAEHCAYSLNGHYNDCAISSKGICVLWPSKEHRTWENWQSVLFKAGDFIYNKKQKKVMIFHHFDTNGVSYSGRLSNGNPEIGALADCRFASNEQIEQFKKEQNDCKSISAYGDLMDIAVRATDFFFQEGVLSDLHTWNATHNMGFSDADLKRLTLSLKSSIKAQILTEEDIN